MIKNILLLFLSDVKTKSIGGKIVVSDVTYNNVVGEPALTTSESAFRYLLQKSSLDKLFIFASKKIREPIAGYRTCDGQELTHLDFFLERVKKFWSDADCEVYPYDEDKRGAENLRSVAEMAGLIQKFAAGNEVTLHVDLTGGMRDVNMMMLDLTRLLDYSGLKIGKLLYSNFGKKNVEELQNIYDLFQLIAGVEEFVNFGSVKALQIYYAGKSVSEQLQKLLGAIENFAESIKLCHYGQFRDAVINLHDAVHDFDKHLSTDVEDILMARLIGRIKEDYRNVIINRELDDAEVIRWCLNHDYLQQALTLYTERIPEYLGEKFIVMSEANAEKISNLIENDRRNYFYYLINVHTSSTDRTFKGLKFYCNAVKSDTVGKKNVDVDAWFERLRAKFAPLKNSLSDEQRLRAQLETFNKIRCDPTLLLDLSSAELDPIREIVDKLSDELLATERVFERKKIIFDFVNKLPNEKKDKDLPIFTDCFPNVVFAKDVREKYPRAFRVWELLYDKFFSVKIPDEKFLNIMEKYFRIRDERHQSNHARADFGEFKTAEELLTFMRAALDEISDALPDQ